MELRGIAIDFWEDDLDVREILAAVLAKGLTSLSLTTDLLRDCFRGRAAPASLKLQLYRSCTLRQSIVSGAARPRPH